MPGAAQKSSLDSFLASYDAPEVAGADADVESAAPAEAVPAGGSSLDRFLSTQGMDEAEIPDEQIAPEPSFAEANMDQFSQFTTRLQAGLAANDTEKLEFLKQKYGPNNAAIKDGKLLWRKNTAEKFKAFDPAAFEVLNDILPDWSREIVQEMTMLPAEIGGAAAGGPGGAIAARALSVPVANYVSDKIAQFAGVPKDESRSVLGENLVGVGVEAVLPVVGSRVVKPVLKQGTKFLPGSRAYQESVKAGERRVIALSKQSAEVAKSVEALNQVGKSARLNGEILGIPGAEVNLMGHQLQPNNPALKGFAAQAANDPRFINAQQQLAEDWGELAENTLKELGRAKAKGPIREDSLAQFVTNAVDDVVTLEGKAIGKYKSKAMAKLGNAPQPLPKEIGEQVAEMMSQFDIRVGQSGKILPPKDLKAHVGKMGLTSVGEVRAVVNNIMQVAGGAQKGLRVSDIDQLRNSIGSTSSRLYRTEAGARLGVLSGDMRKLYRETISKGLDDDFERAAFNSAMDEFSAHRINIGTLKNALDGEASAKAIVGKFFTGKENLGKIKAIKKLSPESFDALREEFTNQLLVDYGSRQNATGLKSSQFLDAMNKKYGSEFLGEVFDKEGVQTLKHVLTVTERIEDTFRKPIETMDGAQKTALVNAAIGVVAKAPARLMSGVATLWRGQMPADHALYQIMTQEGIDKYVAKYPGKVDKKTLLRKMNDVLAEWKFYRQAQEVSGEVTERAVKQRVRQEMQE